MNNFNYLKSIEEGKLYKTKQTDYVEYLLKNCLEKIKNDVKIEVDDFKFCTFKHIYNYLVSGLCHKRLDVALSDFGYTDEEIRNLRKESIISNKDALIKIITEIIDRK